MGNTSRAIANSVHGDPAFGAMGNFEEQELPLQLCIIAIMQKEEWPRFS
jgi:hypothetical protein